MYKIFTKAKDLPRGWDEFVRGNVYLSVQYLSLIERTEKELLNYYVFYDGDVLDSCFVFFVNSNLNLKLLQGKTFYKKANFVYIPVSISRPLFIFGNKTKSEAEAVLNKLKGITVIMNASSCEKIEGFTKGNSFPRCVLAVKWDSFDKYMESLKSPYRRLYKKALKKSEELSMSILPSCDMFDESLYKLYENVYNKSETKLEKLSIDFFKSSIFSTMVFKKTNGAIVGFIQLLENGNELIFEFTGIDYECNEQYDLYKRMLLDIVRYAIDNKFETIDFGQTADRAKLQLGCRHEDLKLFVKSSNVFLNWYFKTFIKKLEHKADNTVYHVFNER